MQRVRSVLVAIALITISGVAFAQEPDAAGTETGDTRAIPLDKIETEEVRLILLDTLVVDKQNRTVPGLTKDDFEIVTRGKAMPPGTLDVACETALEETRAVNRVEDRELPAPDGAGGKIVLAFDYLHLPIKNNEFLFTYRARVLDHAQEMVRHGGIDGEEIMVVALNGGLRIEQSFSGDRDEVLRTLRRMQYDVTLSVPEFSHLNETGWVRGFNTLFDVLGTVPGSKAVVLFSLMRDVPLDLEFQEIAANASSSRCSVYPIDVRGLWTPYSGEPGT